MHVTKYFDKNYRAVVANTFIKKGAKIRAYNMYTQLLLNFKSYGLQNPEDFLKQSLLELQPIVNLRSIKLGGIKYRIPYLIKETNQLTLASM